MIERVYLFDSATLVGQGGKIGTPTSVHQNLWDTAEIYPCANPSFLLNETQRAGLKLFSAEAVG